MRSFDPNEPALGYEDGYDAGFDAGYTDGHVKGYSEGLAEGFAEADTMYQERLRKLYAELLELNARIAVIEKKTSEGN